ncbi:MAG: energy-coupling factor transporter ATPase [Eubacteriales bacterium]|nr:energy-coupling factor transporter ATPase [Eubacteriales bacterium]
MSRIAFDHVSYCYGNQWQGELQYALKDVSFSMEQGEYVAIIGKTGSGKSTFLQHVNGLLKPTEGTVLFNDKDIHQKDVSIRKIRQKVSLCFQYPEYQLFEENVLKDICFGPSNMGYSEEECLKKARYAMDLLELPRSLEKVSPFSLSGGQKRRVALAGILAMEPEFLVLDEPVAGMDQRGKDNLFELLARLNEENEIGIILVSHDMDDVAAHAERLIVMDQGQIIMDDETRKVFREREMFKNLGLELPHPVSFYYKLKDEGFGISSEEEDLPMTVRELANYISLYLPKNRITGGVV